MKEPGRASTLGSIVTPVRDAFSQYRGTALLFIIAAVLGLLGALPISRLASPTADLGTRLEMMPVRGGDFGMHWTSNALSPTMARQGTITVIWGLLLVTAASTLIVTNLTLLSIAGARASARTTEISIRRALGASRRALLASALLEGATITVLALAIGGTLGNHAAGIGAATWPGRLGREGWGPSVVVIMGVSTLIMIGILLQLFSAARGRIVETEPKPLGLYVLAIQFGMTLTVLVAAAILKTHADDIMGTRATSDGGQVFEISLPEIPASDRAMRYQALLEEFVSHPEFTTVSLTSPGTIAGVGANDVVVTECGICRFPLDFVFSTYQFVSADTFHALRIPILSGRGITNEDRLTTPPVAVVSRGLALKNFRRAETMIGRHIRLELNGKRWYTVVGIANDRPQNVLVGGLGPPPTIYLSVMQHPPTDVDLLIRPSARNMLGAQSLVRRNTGLSDIVTEVSESQILAREVAPLRWFAHWFEMEGWTMLIAAMSGTFVVMWLWIRSVRRELGLRRAVGARSRDILWFVIVRAGSVALAGFVISVWFGPALWSSLSEALPGTPSWDVRVMLRLALLLTATCVAGAVLPTLQAMRETPSKLLGSFE